MNVSRCAGCPDFSVVVVVVVGLFHNFNKKVNVFNFFTFLALRYLNDRLHTY